MAHALAHAHQQSNYLEDVRQEFTQACRKGEFEVAKQILEQHPAVRERLNVANRVRFEYVCYTGNVEFAQWFVHEFRISTPDASDAFSGVCGRGRLKMAQWLVSKFDLDVHAHNEIAFIEACAAGRKSVVRWLLREYPETNVRANNDQAFRRACWYGHWNLAAWLVSKRPVLNVRANRDHMFMAACKHGRLDKVHWLYAHGVDLKRATVPTGVNTPHPREIPALRVALSYACNGRRKLKPSRCAPDNYGVMCWLLATWCSADEFWSELVLNKCAEFIAAQTAACRPMREYFMRCVAPELLAARSAKLNVIYQLSTT